ncbi:MAG: PSD1 domain-containing protein [Planctomycetaceae bacterium]|nr:PSD1 domain-containing protein [Planctomycetaceae bacterium]
MIARCAAAFAIFLAVMSSSPGLRGADDNDAKRKSLEFFESRVRPVLVEHCQKCHGPDKQWAGLRLDNRASLIDGGESGPAVTLDDVSQSLILKAVRHDPDASPMPPEGKLTPAQIADLETWIRDGLAFPEGAKVGGLPKPDPNHWSFQPPTDPEVPSVRDTAWVRTGVDAFILSELEKKGIVPAPEADRRTLIRRVTFDLTGLPPEPKDIEAFLADERPDAWNRVVDRLLASTAYGEHWGRHWLDVARYADSNGLDENVAHGNAWKYRDYVVQSFNDDVPYSQFLAEQLAGDLLPAEDRQTRERQLIATGFLSLGPKVIAEVDEKKMQMDIIDEQLDTLGRAFLGMTFGCARCHDHKFDPVSTADYYGLAGILISTRSMESFVKVAKWYENPLPTPESEAAKAAWEQQVTAKKSEIEQFIAAADAKVRETLPEGAPAPEKLETKYPEETTKALKELRDGLAKLEKAIPEVPTAMGVSEARVSDVPIHIRGSHLKLGDVIPRRVPTNMRGPETPEFSQSQSGRLELARWLTDPRHPLTARVLANRVWRWHFGRGLVASTDNFGTLGDHPTHPELLDWLAHRLLEDNWSIKALHRRLVLSSTYRQSTEVSPATLAADLDNRLWSRFNVRRLSAEEVRDSVLATGGLLDRTAGGPVLTVPNRGYLFDHTSKDLTRYDSPRRAIYLPVIRNNVYDFFQLLDYPDPAVANGDRSSTTIAPQALMMLNSDLVMDAAAGLAKRLADEGERDDAAKLDRAYQLAYGRSPTPSEAQQQLAFLEAARRTVSETAGSEQAVDPWSILCQVLLASNEFIYVN